MCDPKNEIVQLNSASSAASSQPKYLIIIILCVHFYEIRQHTSCDDWKSEGRWGTHRGDIAQVLAEQCIQDMTVTLKLELNSVKNKALCLVSDTARHLLTQCKLVLIFHWTYYPTSPHPPWISLTPSHASPCPRLLGGALPRPTCHATPSKSANRVVTGDD